MYDIGPLVAIDFYKADHRRQYPEGTSLVYSNFTPRDARHAEWIPGNKGVVFFGLQAFMVAFLRNLWRDKFFSMPLEYVMKRYGARMDKALGKGAIPLDHIEALHKLQYLPIRIKALPEGTMVPYGVPMLTIENTAPEFFWLTNYLETILSASLWHPCTSATTAWWYKEQFLEHCKRTGSPVDFVPWQGHDFSFRGQTSLDGAVASGAGHLLSFTGTDTVAAIDFIEKYYRPDTEFIGGSVPATEHSVMCMGTDVGEFDTFKRLITELYPTGVVSIVSDTWDLWSALTDYLPRLKDEIMAREGRVVIRPDSGDPVKIVCGDSGEYDNMTVDGQYRYKGAYELLWDTFGGTVNEQGFKVLDPHVGLIYGDAITLPRQKAILDGLEAKGFAASNLVLGVGSFTYQCVTRDVHGFAMKATYGEITHPDGTVEKRDIYKDPITDDGMKKSARGRLAVVDVDGQLMLLQGEEAEKAAEDGRDMLETVFEDSVIVKPVKFKDVRERVDSYHG